MNKNLHDKTDLMTLNDKLNQLNKENEDFFKEAFTCSTTREPYDIPPKLKLAARRICQAYGIRGICDPMYIANVIAKELGLGDGMSNFNK